MSKTEAKTAAQPQVVAEDDITVDEFCTRLSKTDKRVELIGAFHFDEKQAGRIKDADSAFSARFVEFANKPA